MKQYEAAERLCSEFGYNKLFHISKAARVLGFSRSWTRELILRGRDNRRGPRTECVDHMGARGWYVLRKGPPCPGP